MSVRLQRALQDAASHLYAASLHMPSDWQRTKVREWAEKAGRIACASVGRNPEGQDREDGLGRNDEHAVPEGQTPSD